MGPIDNESKIGPTAVSRSISDPVCQKLTFEGRKKDCHFVATSLYQSRHKQARNVGQKCPMRHEPPFFTAKERTKHGCALRSQISKQKDHNSLYKY